MPSQHVATTRQEEAREEITEIDKEVTDLRAEDEREEEDVGGIKGEHDFVTETSEEDVDGMHVKKKMTFEKTIERIPSPARPCSPPMVVEERREEEREEQREERVEETVEEKSEEIYERKTSTHVDRQVEEAEERTVVESAEVVTSAVDVQQMVEKAKREEEERKREEEEEERRKEEERRRKEREEEEERERRRREEEERRRQEEEEERRRHVSFQEEEAEEVEEVREQPLGRTVVREERVTEEESDTPGKKKLVKETYEEITEEVLVQERVRRKGIEEDRKKSLREQVQVHQSLRDQQAPKRVCSKYPPAQEIMEINKKRVQFVKQTDTGPKPIPHSALQNSTPKEWKSEMVNALTTAPDRPFTPLSTSSSVKEVYTEETIYLDHRCRPKPPPKEELRPISPFQEALMIAPERPYTPLSREIGPDDQKIASRSQTPVLQGGVHWPPSDIPNRPPLGLCPPRRPTTASETRLP